MADHSFAGSTNYYGNLLAYITGFFEPGPMAQSVQEFHQSQLHQFPNQWNGTPPGAGGGCGSRGTNQVFPAMILQVNAKGKSPPMLPAQICHFFHCVIAIVGHTGVAELQNTLDFMLIRVL